MLAFSDWFPLATVGLTFTTPRQPQALGIEKGHRGRC